MVPLAGRALGAHYTAQRWQGSCPRAVYTLACWFAPFQSPAWAIHLRPKGILLSEEPQFARDSRKASWDRIRTPKDWGKHTTPQALCGFSLQWFLDIRCFFGYRFKCFSGSWRLTQCVCVWGGGYHWLLRAGRELEGRTGLSVLSSSLTAGAEGESVLFCVWCCWSPDIHNYAESTKSPGTQTFKWHRLFPAYRRPKQTL